MEKTSILAIADGYVDFYKSVLQGIADTPELQGRAKTSKLGTWLRPYDVVDNILTIPVRGALISGFPYQLYDWATGYDYIRDAYNKGINDKKVDAIVLDIDSPGGTVQGIKELSQTFSAGRGQKPVGAHINFNALSAGYFVASQADTIMAQPSAHLGSIGVRTEHIDLSGFLRQRGIRITHIFAGKHKVDGNPDEPLSPSVKQNIQQRIDKSYDYFVKEVSNNRNLDYEDVAKTEAAIFDAEESLANGLADNIIGEESFSMEGNANMFSKMLKNQKDAAEIPKGVTQLSSGVEEQIAPCVQTIDKETGTMETNDNGKSPTGTIATEDTSLTKEEILQAERKRMNDIMSSDQFVGREDLAKKMLFETEMSSETILDMLAAAPSVSAKAEKKTQTQNQSANPFEQAMNKHSQSDVQAEDDDDLLDTSPQSVADEVFASLGLKERDK